MLHLIKKEKKKRKENFRESTCDENYYYQTEKHIVLLVETQKANKKI